MIKRTSSVQPLVLKHGGLDYQASFAMAGAMEIQSATLPPESFLNDTELAKLHGFQFTPKKQGFLLGRLAAKRALAELLSEPDLCRIEIFSGVFGQPVLRHPRSDALEISVSHSNGNAVALAFPGEFPMGIDLETVPAASAETLAEEMALSVLERAWMAETSTSPTIACGLLWTAREALGKMLKLGLGIPMHVLSLGRIQAMDSAAWVSQYHHFLQCQCRSRAFGERVMSIAMPKDVELSPWPGLE
jgi:4'-phosphopantetheinyl transferase